MSVTLPSQGGVSRGILGNLNPCSCPAVTRSMHSWCARAHTPTLGVSRVCVENLELHSYLVVTKHCALLFTHRTSVKGRLTKMRDLSKIQVLLLLSVLTHKELRNHLSHPYNKTKAKKPKPNNFSWSHQRTEVSRQIH